MSIILRLGVVLIAAITPVAALSGCVRSPVLIDTIAGAKGSSARIAWVKSSVRPRVQPNQRFWAHPGVAVDANLNVYLLDRLTEYGSQRGWWLSKYDPAGTETWTVKMPPKPGQNLVAHSVALDPSGNIVVAAVGLRSAQGLYLYKYSPRGELIWGSIHEIDNKRQGGRFTLAFSPGGDIYVGGTVLFRGRKPWLGKFSPAGQFQWERRPLDRKMTEGDGRYVEFIGGLVMFHTNEHSRDPSGPADRGRQAYFRPDGTETMWSERSESAQESDIQPRVLFSRQLAEEGPRGFEYRIPLQAEDSLNAWLEIRRAGRSFLRLQVAKASEEPGEQFVMPRELVVDDAGTAYLLTVEAGGSPWATRLYKVDVELPPVSPKILELAANAVKSRPPRLTQAIAAARRRGVDEKNAYLLDILHPRAEWLDKRIERLARGAEKLSHGEDGEALALYSTAVRRMSQRWSLDNQPDPEGFMLPAAPKSGTLERYIARAATLRWQGRRAVADGIEAFEADSVEEGFGLIIEANGLYTKVVEIVKGLD